jgi:hypothetical protein
MDRSYVPIIHEYKIWLKIEKWRFIRKTKNKIMTASNKTAGSWPRRKKHSRPYARRGPDRTAGGDGEALVWVSNFPPLPYREERERGSTGRLGEREGR